MYSYFKSEGHLDIVRQCPCLICSGLFYHLDKWDYVVAKIKEWVDDPYKIRKSDAHHLQDDEGGRRRSNDWAIPLCRTHHAWMDTAQGKLWEKQSYNALRRVALELGVHSGFVRDIERARATPDDQLLLSGFIVDQPEGGPEEEDSPPRLGIPKSVSAKRSRLKL